MIGTIYWISFLRLWHNKAELALTFVVPVVFFSIFAMILGDRSRNTSGKTVPIVVCDEVQSELSLKAIGLIKESKSVRIVDGATSTKASESRNRSAAMRLVQHGEATMVVVLKKTSSNANKADQAKSAASPSLLPQMPQVELITDSYDQIAPQVISGLIQKSLSTALQETMPKSSSTVQQASHQQASAMTIGPQQTSYIPPGPAMPVAVSLPDIRIVDLLGQRKSNPVIAMYAAGIAVMFLLFSTTAASGSLLEERENNTLERMLASQMTMDQLLMGKWCFLLTIGCTQLTLMFVWGQIVFGVDLLGHWDGFAAMTLVTAGAASSFALLLAAICRTRAQLNWLSVVVILSMSALGGSMVPRYLMSDAIQKAGLITFNGWALDGYNKIFWRDLPLSAIGLELGVLTFLGLAFIIIARVLALRWEHEG